MIVVRTCWVVLYNARNAVPDAGIGDATQLAAEARQTKLHRQFVVVVVVVFVVVVV